MIHPIGEWVLREACAQAQAWTQVGSPDLRVSVNISGKQFVEAGFADLVREVLADTGLGAGRLELEITESVLMRDADEAARTVEILRRDGVRVLIDDFGTGYSSLVYLKRLPVDGLKIAQDFVRDVAHDRRDAAIVEAIVGLGRNLGLEVIAEGVETDRQAQALRRLGCPLVQGFHFDRPLEHTEIHRRLT